MARNVCLVSSVMSVFFFQYQKLSEQIDFWFRYEIICIDLNLILCYYFNTIVPYRTSLSFQCFNKAECAFSIETRLSIDLFLGRGHTIWIQLTPCYHLLKLTHNTPRENIQITTYAYPFRVFSCSVFFSVNFVVIIAVV